MVSINTLLVLTVSPQLAVEVPGRDLQPGAAGGLGTRVSMWLGSRPGPGATGSSAASWAISRRTTWAPVVPSRRYWLASGFREPTVERIYIFSRSSAVLLGLDEKNACISLGCRIWNATC